MEEIFSAVLTLVMFGLLLEVARRRRRDRREARRRGPVRGRVVSVDRVEHRTRTASWLVTTVYEVPGHADLLHHRRFFEDEGPALLWARLHREGSEHDVFPNRREPGVAFVAEDLRERDVVVLVLLVAMGALLAVALWQLAAWYLSE